MSAGALPGSVAAGSVQAMHAPCVSDRQMTRNSAGARMLVSSGPSAFGRFIYIYGDAMSTGHCLVAIPPLVLAVLLVNAPSQVLAAGVVTGGVADDGYVAGAFEKLGRHWSPPPGLHGDFKVQVEVLVDERGRIAGCTTRQSSGMDAFDVAACGAVEQAGNLGVPPGGKPMTLYCTFQSQRDRERRPDPARACRCRSLRRPWYR